MAKIAFILLCHRDPDAVIRQATSLTAAGDCMAIHFDARAPKADYDRIRSALADNPSVTFTRTRIRCGWGQWSLVKATLAAARAALEAFPRATHLYMLSGDCMAIKPADYAHAFLDRHDADFIESSDFFTSGWIRTGWVEERLTYRHWFNERTQKTLFYASFALQKRLGLTRAIPRDLEMMIGSQWWCLRRGTVEAILGFCRSRPDVIRFFRSTWIPDETFFQTLVRHLVPETEIESRTLTFLLFTDYGMPVVFHNDQYDLLLAQDYLFARKISPYARDLRRRLGVLYASEGLPLRISDEGRSLFGFLPSRGRIGRRFAPRIWEAESTLGHDRSLLIVVCRKRQVADRLLRAVAAQTGLPCIGYLFTDESCALPDLGGLQSTLAKRHRHRRALLRMLFDYYGSARLVICLDPANLDLMQDFCRDSAPARLLEIDCRLSDSDLIRHATEAGLASAQTPADRLAHLLPTLRNDIRHQSDQIREAGFDHHLLLRDTDPPETQARAVAQFLSVSDDTARAITRTTPLFAD